MLIGLYVWIFFFMNKKKVIMIWMIVSVPWGIEWRPQGHAGRFDEM